jgi:Ca-activated chloride channel family protein
LLFLCIAKAEPRWGIKTRDLSNKGVDIVMAMDISGSMLAMDLAPKIRLSAAVSVQRILLKRRSERQIWFSCLLEYAITQNTGSLLTFGNVEFAGKTEMNEEASATASKGLQNIALLHNSTAKSRVIILITDGVSKPEK